MYSTDPTIVAARSAKLREKAAQAGSAAPLALYYPDMRDGHEQEDWDAFRAELDAVDQQESTPGSLRRTVEVNGDEGLRSVMQVWIMKRVIARREAAEREWIANSVSVQEWRGHAFGKPRRIARSEIGAWADRPGCILIEREPGIVLPEDTGHDELSFGGGARVRTMPIGAELPEGTVKAKRLIRDDERGLVVQYLVRRRGRAAERRYHLTQRWRELDRQVRLGWEYITNEERSEKLREMDQLRAELTARRGK